MLPKQNILFCESVEHVVKSLVCKKRVGLQWCYMRRACENETANYDVSQGRHESRERSKMADPTIIIFILRFIVTLN